MEMITNPNFSSTIDEETSQEDIQNSEIIKSFIKNSDFFDTIKGR